MRNNKLSAARVPEGNTSESAKPDAEGDGEPGSRRDRGPTRWRILETAMREFADRGFSGGRVDRISQAAGVNVRMIYHYFGDKEGLYLEVLEESYRKIRTLEQNLDLPDDDPEAAMKRLIEVTFDFLSTDPFFVRLVMNENLNR